MADFFRSNLVLDIGSDRNPWNWNEEKTTNYLRNEALNKKRRRCIKARDKEANLPPQSYSERLNRLDLSWLCRYDNVKKHRRYLKYIASEKKHRRCSSPWIEEILQTFNPLTSHSSEGFYLNNFIK